MRALKNYDQMFKVVCVECEKSRLDSGDDALQAGGSVASPRPSR